jgi:hypothetical protein
LIEAAQLAGMPGKLLADNHYDTNIAQDSGHLKIRTHEMARKPYFSGLFWLIPRRSR